MLTSKKSILRRREMVAWPSSRRLEFVFLFFTSNNCHKPASWGSSIRAEPGELQISTNYALESINWNHEHASPQACKLPNARSCSIAQCPLVLKTYRSHSRFAGLGLGLGTAASMPPDS